MVLETVGGCVIAAITKQGLRALLERAEWKANFDWTKTIDELGEDLLVAYAIELGYKTVKSIRTNPEARALFRNM